MKTLRTTEERDRFSREKYEAARTLKYDTPENVALAVRFLNDSINVRPTFANALLLRASLVSKSGDYASALTDLSVAIQLEYQSDDRRRLAQIHGSRATIYFKQNRPQEGLQDLIRASELEPDNGNWLFESGRAFMKQGNLIFAEQYFVASLSERVTGRMSEGAKYKTLRNLGVCRLHNGETRLAIATLSRALDLSDTAEIHNLLGLANYREGAMKHASSHFQRAVEMDVQGLGYYVDLAVCAFQLEHLDEARRCFTEALRRRSDSAELYFFRACTSIKQGTLGPALRDLDTAISLDPQPRYLYTRGFVHARASLAEGDNSEKAAGDGEDPTDGTRLSLASAELNFQHALERDPSLRHCLIHLGLLTHQSGRLHEALQYLHAALELDCDDAALVERVGLVYADLGFHDLAVRYFGHCRALSPSSGMFAFRMAVAQIASGDPYGALESLKIAMDELGVDSAAALHARAVALLRLNVFEEAAVWVEKALRKDSHRSYTYALTRAEIHFNMGEAEACIAAATTVLRLQDDVAEAHYLRARACHALDRVPEALEDLMRAAELAPALMESHIFCYVQGVLLAHQSMWAEALTALGRAIAFTPTEKEVGPRSVYFHERAKVHQALGNGAAAAEDFGVVLKRQPSNLHALIRRAFALKSIGRFDDSSRDWQRAMQLDTTGAIAGITSREFYDIEYIELCKPGEEEDNDECVACA